MAMPVIGTHRIKNEGHADGVWITDGPGGFEIPENWYVSNGYWPALTDMPWGESVPGGGIE